MTYRLVTDFLVPSLNRKRFGDLLKWDTVPGVFLVKWTHKAKSTWHKGESAVYMAWDAMKGRPAPVTDQELVNSKQRLRAALRNLQTIVEVESSQKGYKRFQLVSWNTPNDGSVIVKPKGRTVKKEPVKKEAKPTFAHVPVRSRPQRKVKLEGSMYGSYAEDEDYYDDPDYKTKKTKAGKKKRQTRKRRRTVIAPEISDEDSIIETQKIEEEASTSYASPANTFQEEHIDVEEISELPEIIAAVEAQVLPDINEAVEAQVLPDINEAVEAQELPDIEAVVAQVLPDVEAVVAQLLPHINEVQPEVDELEDNDVEKIIPLPSRPANKKGKRRTNVRKTKKKDDKAPTGEIEVAFQSLQIKQEKLDDYYAQAAAVPGPSTCQSQGATGIDYYSGYASSHAIPTERNKPEDRHIDAPKRKAQNVRKNKKKKDDKVPTQDIEVDFKSLKIKEEKLSDYYAQEATARPGPSTLQSQDIQIVDPPKRKSKKVTKKSFHIKQEELSDHNEQAAADVPGTSEQKKKEEEKFKPPSRTSKVSQESWADSFKFEEKDIEVIEHPLRRSTRNKTKVNYFEQYPEPRMSPKTKASKATIKIETKETEDKTNYSANDAPVIMATGSDNGTLSSMAPTGDSSSVPKPKESKSSKRRARAQKKKAVEKHEFPPALGIGQPSTSNCNATEYGNGIFAMDALAGCFNDVPCLDLDDIMPTIEPVDIKQEEEEYDFGGPLTFYYATTEEEWRRDNMLGYSDITLGAAAYCLSTDPLCECDICTGRTTTNPYM